MSLVRGQLAALFYLGYESKINYISMVSGGAWGAANYYALDNHIRENYLGSVLRMLQPFIREGMIQRTIKILTGFILIVLGEPRREWVFMM